MRIRNILLWCFLALLGGCQEKAPSHKLEIVGLDPESPTDFSLKIVEMTPEIDIANLRTKEFEFLNGIKIYQSDTSKIALASTSFAVLREKLRAHFLGEPINVQALLEHDIYRGEDFDSLLLLSSFYHLHQIIQFAKNSALAMPARSLRVGFHGQIYLNANEPALRMEDNALYLGAADTIILFPVAKGQGLPMSINEGVLAHEYFHRIFFEKLWVDNPSPKLWSFFQARYTNSQDLQRWQNLLTSLDEGLADLFAFAYTNNPNFLKLSLNQNSSERVIQLRNLKGDFAELATYDNLSAGSLHKSLLNLCREPSRNFINPNFSPYCLGMVVAKSFYEASEANVLRVKTVVLPIINQALGDVSEALQEQREFDMDIFLAAVAKRAEKIDEPFYRKFCEQMRGRFQSLVNQGRIASCDGL